jgi:integrase
MRLLRAGVDTSVIALWLGHEQIETMNVYLHADLAIKERALAQTPAELRVSMTWAQRLKRVFDIDIETCSDQEDTCSLSR